LRDAWGQAISDYIRPVFERFDNKVYGGARSVPSPRSRGEGKSEGRFRLTAACSSVREREKERAVDDPTSLPDGVARGGTELMLARLRAALPADLLGKFQIVASRFVGPLDGSKLRIAWIHDLAGDPLLGYLKNEGWKRFHLLVFVSNWQMQTFIRAYGIPWSRCIVMENAIPPIAGVTFDRPTPTIRLIYTPTPHRGLNIRLGAFPTLLQEFPNLELDVFSSFRLYGSEGRDAEFEPLFRFCRQHPKIRYHGTQPNAVVREALTRAHVFAYPSVWPETSCLCLIEAMSAGLVCVHSNLGALFETAAHWTQIYPFHEDPAGIRRRRPGSASARAEALADRVYDWNVRKRQWEGLLRQMLSWPRDFGATA
jgi:UDP-glucose:(glucosyl)LPS alpha-1,2-glucosyltransferase